MELTEEEKQVLATEAPMRWKVARLKECGRKGVQIAALLNITPARVSQIIGKRRAKKQ